MCTLYMCIKYWLTTMVSMTHAAFSRATNHPSVSGLQLCRTRANSYMYMYACTLASCTSYMYAAQMYVIVV